MGRGDCENVDPLLIQEVCRLSDCESEKLEEKVIPKDKTEENPVEDDSYREHFFECAVKKPLEEDTFEEDYNIYDFLVKSEEFEDDLPGVNVERAPQKCPDCAIVFPEIKQLREHVRIHNRSSLCPRGFASPENLRQHLRTHTGENPFKCFHCSKTYNLWRCLKAHLKTHTGKGAYKCNDCSKTFSENKKLIRHTKTHTQPHECPTCSKRFGDHTNFRKHMESQHLRKPREDKPASCEICAKIFANCTSLKRHMHTHAVDLPSKCIQCPRAFANNNNLRRHTRVVHVEPGKRPFQCSQCPKKFRMRSEF